ncbi:alpha/beta hydrolase [Dongia deserti]|uniref:alpha/beta hydrolase n=1 Tax=Dongia deserti TaxID=2268030 RepID=UPI000E65DE49|nr:alpha/beta hydrolase [Dongia deserti]
MAKDPFRNRDYVANFDALVEEYKARSAITRETHQMKRDIAYGTGANERLDLFFPKGSSGAGPVHLFIHGGYWRMFSKDDFSFIADTVTAAGAIAAIMDYDLMPDVRLNTIVAQVRKAIQWLTNNSGTYGGDTGRLSVSGHSAGAHLASFTFCQGAGVPRPASALLLSGVYDLKPLQSSFLQPLIGLTDQEVTAFSPLLLQHERGTRVIVAYGARETDPFRNQGSSFAQHLEHQGLFVSEHMLRDADHMSAVRDLGIPGSAAGDLLIRAIRDSQPCAQP